MSETRIAISVTGGLIEVEYLGHGVVVHHSPCRETHIVDISGSWPDQWIGLQLGVKLELHAKAAVQNIRPRRISRIRNSSAVRTDIKRGVVRRKIARARTIRGIERNERWKGAILGLGSQFHRDYRSNVRSNLR